MGTETDGGDMLAILIVGLLALSFYMLPAMIASYRHHRNANAIYALNMLTGWTLIGWVGSLVWALTVQDENQNTSSDQ